MSRTQCCRPARPLLSDKYSKDAAGEIGIASRFIASIPMSMPTIRCKFQGAFCGFYWIDDNNPHAFPQIRKEVHPSFPRRGKRLIHDCYSWHRYSSDGKALECDSVLRKARRECADHSFGSSSKRHDTTKSANLENRNDTLTKKCSGQDNVRLRTGHD